MWPIVVDGARLGKVKMPPSPFLTLTVYDIRSKVLFGPHLFLAQPVTGDTNPPPTNLRVLELVFHIPYVQKVHLCQNIVQRAH
jgi:hypothetical protein